MLTESIVMSEQSQYVTIEDAALEVGVNRSTMYYYLKRFSIEPERFPLDRRTYILRSDLERIKGAKRAAEQKLH